MKGKERSGKEKENNEREGKDVTRDEWKERKGKE